MKDLNDYYQLRVIVIIVAFFSTIFCCLGFKILWKRRIRRMKCLRKYLFRNKTAHFHEHTKIDVAQIGKINNNHGFDQKIGVLELMTPVYADQQLKDDLESNANKDCSMIKECLDSHCSGQGAQIMYSDEADSMSHQNVEVLD